QLAVARAAPGLEVMVCRIGTAPVGPAGPRLPVSPGSPVTPGKPCGPPQSRIVQYPSPSRSSDGSQGLVPSKSQHLSPARLRGIFFPTGNWQALTMLALAVAVAALSVQLTFAGEKNFTEKRMCSAAEPKVVGTDPTRKPPVRRFEPPGGIVTGGCAFPM